MTIVSHGEIVFKREEDKAMELLFSSNSIYEMAVVLRDEYIDKYRFEVDKDLLKKAVDYCLSTGRLYKKGEYSKTLIEVLRPSRMKILDEIVREIIEEKRKK